MMPAQDDSAADRRGQQETGHWTGQRNQNLIDPSRPRGGKGLAAVERSQAAEAVERNRGVKPIKPHHDGMAQFVNQKCHQQGRNPRQHLWKVAFHSQQESHQPEHRVNAHRKAQQREMNVALGSWGFVQEHR